MFSGHLGAFKIHWRLFPEAAAPVGLVRVNNGNRSGFIDTNIIATATTFRPT
jgi:hypothetical protein